MRVTVYILRPMGCMRTTVYICIEVRGVSHDAPAPLSGVFL